MIIYAPMYVSIMWALILAFSPKPRKKDKVILSAFMFCTAVLYLSHAAFFTNHYSLYLILDSFYVLSSLSVYPFFYWYIKLLTKETDYHIKNLSYFLPALIFSILVAVLYLIMDQPLIYIEKYFFNEGTISGTESTIYRLQKTVHILIRLVFFIQIVWFLIGGLKLIRSFDQRINEFYSNVEGRSIRWAKWLLVIFTSTAFLSATANFIGRNFFTKLKYIVIVPALGFSTLIFIIGFWGNFRHYNVSDLVLEENKDDEIRIHGKRNHQDIKNRLLILFEQEKIYKRPDLKISQLSQLVATNRTYISNIINDEFKCSFNDFVNRYRVAEAKEILQQHKNAKYNLERVAEESGFTSVGALIRNFGKIEGITPGNYRKKMERNN